jgi:hypothetical protein
MQKKFNGTKCNEISSKDSKDFLEALLYLLNLGSGPYKICKALYILSKDHRLCNLAILKIHYYYFMHANCWHVFFECRVRKGLQGASRV